MEIQVKEQTENTVEKTNNKRRKPGFIFLSVLLLSLIGMSFLIYYLIEPKVMNVNDMVITSGVIHEAGSAEPFTGTAEGYIKGGYVIAEIKDGRYNGAVRQYYQKDGHLFYEEFYGHGIKDTRFTYFPDGQIFEQVYYVLGNLNRRITYYSNGLLKYDIAYNKIYGDEILEFRTRDGRDVTKFAQTLQGAWSTSLLSNESIIVFSGDRIYTSEKYSASIEFLDDKTFLMKRDKYESIIEFITISDKLIRFQEKDDVLFFISGVRYFPWTRKSYFTDFPFVKKEEL